MVWLFIGSAFFIGISEQALGLDEPFVQCHIFCCIKLCKKHKMLYISLCRNLALGIGIQNFPEGLAVSLPLKASGVDTWKSFWYNLFTTNYSVWVGVEG